MIEQSAENKVGDPERSDFLTFRLGDEAYAINILKVQEIRGVDAVTAIANTPEFIKGVIDLRGVIVPIVDLRVKFSLASAGYDEFTVVVILNLASRIIGVVVDSVSDVITLAYSDIKPVPLLGSAVDTSYLLGVARLNELMVLVLDIERLMTSSEMQLIDAADANSAVKEMAC